MPKDRPRYQTQPAPRRVSKGSVSRPRSASGGGIPRYQPDSPLRRVKAPL